MATVFKRGRSYAVQFADLTGERRTLGLGKVTKEQARLIGGHLEALVAARRAGVAPPPATAAWLGTISAELRTKLARLGLVDEAAPASGMTLGGFLTEYLDNRKPTIKPGTLMNLSVAVQKLLDYFGPDKALASITVAEATRFAAHLDRTQAPATAGRLIRRARQFFKVAVQQKLVPENPFADVKAGSNKPNKDRQAFIPREVIEQVIAAAPDVEWRLIIALSRYAGLRCPTEHLALRWSDVNWERNRFRVDSPKTGERWVPIFPELRPYLEAAWEAAPEGTEYVICRYRTTNVNLRTQFERIIWRAGLTPWPKLFHNLRASRQTELAERFPIHAVCYWLGNSALIAQKHYLQVRDEDFENAARCTFSPGALQKALQQDAKPSDGEVRFCPDALQKPPSFPRSVKRRQEVYKRSSPRV